MVAVILCSLGTLIVSLASLGAAVLYADGVYARELRIQVRFYERACMDTMEVMAYKDYFLEGEVLLPEFYCRGEVVNTFSGNVKIRSFIDLHKVTSQGEKEIFINP